MTREEAIRFIDEMIAYHVDGFERGVADVLDLDELHDKLLDLRNLISREVPSEVSDG